MFTSLLISYMMLLFLTLSFLLGSRSFTYRNPMLRLLQVTPLRQQESRMFYIKKDNRIASFQIKNGINALRCNVS